MCGIAGVVSARIAASLRASCTERLLGRLTHRGPDAAQTLPIGPAAFGCARLSIVGGARSRQPHVYGDSMLVLNGEVFNHRAVRSVLRVPDGGWRSQGDTEVLHHLLIQADVEGLASIEGQFALAWWNGASGVLTLSRDYDGIVPLYYRVASGHALIFASEPGPLVDPGVGLAVARLSAEKCAISGVLWGTPPGESVFDDIRQVLPGTSVQFDDSGNLLQATEAAAANQQQPASGGSLIETLSEAIELRVPDEVNYGVLVSGGLDSALVAAIATRANHPPAAAYSVQFPFDGELDESVYQKEVARATGLPLRAIAVTDAEVAAALPRVVRHVGAPLIRLAPVHTYFLAHLMRDDGVRVALGGEGADEVFWGYDIFKTAQLASAPSKSLTSSVGSVFGGMRPAEHRAIALGLTVHRGSSEVFMSHNQRWRTTASKIGGMLSDAELAGNLLELAVQRVRDIVPPEFAGRSVLERTQYLEERLFLHSSLLASQSDRVLMAASVEGRHPFLDKRVRLIAASLPGSGKLNGLNEKFALKQAAAGIVPVTIVGRPKRPYTAPAMTFFRSEAGQRLINTTLDRAAIESSGWFVWSRVEWLLGRVRSGKPTSFYDELLLVWLLTTELLRRTYLEG